MFLSDACSDRRTMLKLAALGLCAGYRRALGYESPPALLEATDAMRSAASTSNAFAAALHKQLGTNPGNLFYSPASISAALAMTAAGAEGETREEMFSVLHADPAHEAAWLEGMGGLSKTLNAQGDGYRLQMANRLWGQQGYAFHRNYLERLAREFNAPLGELNFVAAPEPSRVTINQWVSDQTNQRIPELLPDGSVTVLTRLVLTNAIYFKADWLYPFNKDRTQNAPFALAAGNSADVPLMNQTKRFGYFEDDMVQVLDMPYQSGGLSMTAVLPKQPGDLARVEQQLTADRVAAWTKALRRAEVVVAFPKFKLEAAFTLNDVLSELGMPRAFSEQAEFGRMTSAEELKISAVIHKAFVEVDETGTEAAAATGVVMEARAAIPSEPKVFRADRPFLFMIRHQQSGAILFAGRLSDPRG